tara:strand:- start:335 stop:736 length:402 start_codon:yes stop_codon:yes gene_type:complete
MCTSFKTELLGGVQDLDTDTLYIALFTSSATINAATTTYSTTNEVVGTGYTAGGNALTGAVISADGTTAIVDFDNTTWVSSTITARGAMIYNSTKANRVIAILDFGTDKTSTDGDFTIQFPAADASNAILRIA